MRSQPLSTCRNALKADPFCFEAYEALMWNHMLTGEQERELLDSIQIQEEDSWLRLLYSTMCKKVRHCHAVRTMYHSPVYHTYQYTNPPESKNRVTAVRQARPGGTEPRYSRREGSGSVAAEKAAAAKLATE